MLTWERPVREAYALAGQRGDLAYRSAIAAYLAEALLDRGDVAAAEELADNASLGAADGLAGRAWWLLVRSRAALARGEAAEAAAMAHRAVSALAGTEDPFARALALRRLADALDRAGDHEQAAHRRADAQQLAREKGIAAWEGEAEQLEAGLERLVRRATAAAFLGDDETAVAAYARVLAEGHRRRSRVVEAALVGLAGCWAERDPGLAGRLLGHAPTDHPQRGELVGRLAARLGEGALAQALRDGSRLSRDDAVRLAIDAAQGPAQHAAGPTGEPLTRRELEVLQLIARGMTNGEIARTLFISPKTVSIHVSRVLAKLHVRNRSQATARAHELRLVTRATDLDG
jgi:DNA-binding CsgD family transcriptional regulator